MTLTSGTRLGPYEIFSPLGAGGMGEVYRARDTRLDREVAIKVLPSHLSENPEFRARFEREAKTISGLQHPNICVLYDVGLGDYVFAASQSRDGRYAFFSIQDAKTSFDIYFMDLAGDRKLVPVLNTPYAERDPKLSPDNRWLAYTSDENGALELYVTPFPGGGSKWQVSSGGVVKTDANANPEDWAPDGKSLYYRYGDKVYIVEVRTSGSKPEFSAPKELMTIPQGVDLISILPDGKRILAIRSVGQRSASLQNLVLNWQHLVR